eukprot:Ihof_evm2s205 gene=Ihof_evmTU2s205
MEETLGYCDIINRGPLDGYSRKDAVQWTKNRMQACRSLADTVIEANTNGLSEARVLLIQAVEGLLQAVNDNDSDIRLVADECLNRVINGYMTNYVYSLQVELYKEIKKVRPPSRSLRTALTKFGELAPLTRAIKGPTFEKYLIPALVNIMRRDDDDLIQETMGRIIDPILCTFGPFTTLENANLLLQATMENIQSPSAVVRRSGSAVAGESISRIIDMISSRPDAKVLEFGCSIRAKESEDEAQAATPDLHILLLELTRILIELIAGPITNIANSGLDCLHKIIKLYATDMHLLLAPIPSEAVDIDVGYPDDESQKILAAELLARLMRLLVPMSSEPCKNAKVSTKVAAVNCLACLYAACPDLFTAKVAVGQEGKEDLMVCGRDVMAYAYHSDPLLKSGALTALSSLIKSFLRPSSKTLSLEGMLTGEPITCDEFRKMCQLLGEKLWEESSQTVKSACTAIGCCLEPLLKYAYQGQYWGFIGLELLQGMITILQGCPYWLVQLEILDIFGSVPWVVKTNNQLPLDHKMGPITVPQGLQNLALQLVLQCLGDNDGRIRAGASRCLSRLCGTMLNPVDRNYTSPIAVLGQWSMIQSITGTIGTERVLNDFYIQGDIPFDETPSPLLDQASSSTMVIANVTRVVGLLVAKLQGTLTHGPQHAGTVPFTHVSRTSCIIGCYSALAEICQVYGDYTNLDQAGCTNQSLKGALHTSHRSLIGCMPDVLLPTLDLLSTEMCADLTAHSIILPVLADMCQDMGSAENSTYAVMALKHLLYVVNICVHVYTHVVPMQRKDPSSKPTEGSNDTLYNMTNFSGQPAYMELYRQLVRTQTSATLKLSIQSPDKFQIMINNSLLALSQLIEAMGSRIRPYSDELFLFLKILLPKATLPVLTCIDQLAVALFIERKSPGSNFPEPVKTELKYSGMFSQWYEEPVDRLHALWTTTIGDTEMTCNGSTLNKRSSTVKEYVAQAMSDQSKYKRHDHDKADKRHLLTKFEPLMIVLMNQYCNTGNIDLQKGVLMLLARIINFGITYANLDPNNLFVGFLNKQLEFICNTQPTRGTHVVGAMFQLIVLLAKIPGLSDIARKVASKGRVLVMTPSLDVLIGVVDNMASEAAEAPTWTARIHLDKCTIAALDAIVFDVLLRVQTLPDDHQDMTEIETRVFKLLLRVMHHPTTLCMLGQVLWLAQVYPVRWLRMCNMALEGLDEYVRHVYLCVDTSAQLTGCYAFVDSLASTSFNDATRPANWLITISSTTRGPTNPSLHEWLPLMLVILRLCCRTPLDNLLLAINRASPVGESPSEEMVQGESGQDELGSIGLTRILLDILSSALHGYNAVDPNPLLSSMMSHLVLYIATLMGSPNKPSALALTFGQFPSLLSSINQQLEGLTISNPSLILLWQRVLATALQPFPKWAILTVGPTNQTGLEESNIPRSPYGVDEGPIQVMLGHGSFLWQCHKAVHQQTTQPINHPTLYNLLLTLADEPIVRRALASTSLDLGDDKDGFLATTYKNIAGMFYLGTNGQYHPLRAPLKITPTLGLSILSCLKHIRPCTQSSCLVSLFLALPYVACRRQAKSLIQSWVSEQPSSPPVDTVSSHLPGEVYNPLRLFLQALPPSQDVTEVIQALDGWALCMHHDVVLVTQEKPASFVPLQPYEHEAYMSQVYTVATTPSHFVHMPSAFLALLVPLSTGCILTLAMQPHCDIGLLGLCVKTILDRVHTHQVDRHGGMDETTLSYLQTLHGYLANMITTAVTGLNEFVHDQHVPDTNQVRNWIGLSRSISAYLSHGAIIILAQSPKRAQHNGLSVDEGGSLAEEADLSTFPDDLQYSALLLTLVSRYPSCFVLEDTVRVLVCTTYTLQRGSEPGAWWEMITRAVFALFLVWFPLSKHIIQLYSPANLWNSTTIDEPIAEGPMVAQHTVNHRMLAAMLSYFREALVHNRKDVTGYLFGPMRDVVVRLCSLDSGNINSHMLCVFRGDGYNCIGQYKETILLQAEECTDPDMIAYVLPTVHLLGTATLDSFNHTWAVLMEVLDRAIEGTEDSFHLTCLAIRGLVRLLQEHSVYQAQWTTLLRPELEATPPNAPLAVPSLYTLHQDLDRSRTVSPVVSSPSLEGISYRTSLISCSTLAAPLEDLLMTSTGSLEQRVNEVMIEEKTTLMPDDIKKTSPVINRSSGQLLPPTVNSRARTTTALLGRQQLNYPAVLRASLPFQNKHLMPLLCDPVEHVLTSPYFVSDNTLHQETKEKHLIDLSVCADKLLVRFSQYIDGTAANQHSPLILLEIVKTGLLLCNLQPTVNMYRWVCKTFSHLYSLYSDMMVLVPYLLAGLCKTTSALGVDPADRKNPVVMRLIEQVLLLVTTNRTSTASANHKTAHFEEGPAHMSTVTMEICLIQGLLCILQSAHSGLLTPTLPAIIKYCMLVFEPTGTQGTLPRSANKIPRLYMGVVALMLRLIMVFPAFTTKACFQINCVSVFSRMAADRSTPDVVYHGLMHALEYLVLRMPSLRPTIKSSLRGDVTAPKLSTVQRSFSSIALNITLIYMSDPGSTSFTSNESPQYEDYVNQLFQVVRKGVQAEAILLVKILPALLESYYPPHLTLTTVMGEYLAATEITAESLTLVTMNVFGRLYATGQKVAACSMVVLSLNSFTRKYKEPLALAIMTALFTSLSSNPWVRALQPFVLKGLHNPMNFDSNIFLQAATDFYYDV